MTEDLKKLLNDTLEHLVGTEWMWDGEEGSYRCPICNTDRDGFRNGRHWKYCELDTLISRIKHELREKK